MVPAGIEAVVFDAVGTLLHPEPSAVEVYAEVGRRQGTRHTAEGPRTEPRLVTPRRLPSERPPARYQPVR